MTLLDWQLLLKITRISNNELSFDNVVLKFQKNIKKTVISLDLTSSVSMPKTLKTHDFLHIFNDFKLFRLENNNFLLNFDKIKGILRNTAYLSNFDVFSMKKIVLKMRIAENILNDSLLRVLLKEIRPNKNIFINFKEIIKNFIKESNILYNQYNTFVSAIKQNFMDFSHESEFLIILFDFRDFELIQYKNLIDELLMIFYKVFEDFHKVYYFHLIYTQIPISFKNMLEISLNFDDYKLLSIFIQILLNNIEIFGISNDYDSRIRYFQAICSIISNENLKNLYSLVYKISKNINKMIISHN